MSSLNKIHLIGNLGKDPLLSYIDGERPLAKLSIATDQQQSTQWHQVIAWGELAEYVVTNIHKGDLIYIDGKLIYRSWEDRQGNPQRDVHIVAKEIYKL